MRHWSQHSVWVVHQNCMMGGNEEELLLETEREMDSECKHVDVKQKHETSKGTVQRWGHQIKSDVSYVTFDLAAKSKKISEKTELVNVDVKMCAISENREEIQPSRDKHQNRETSWNQLMDPSSLLQFNRNSGFYSSQNRVENVVASFHRLLLAVLL